jgi:uroporphyrinogen decarboxylase
MENCLAAEDTDRPPVALWRHFPVDDQTPGGLAAATANYQRIYDYDFVKVTPASSFCIRDWGVEDEWRGAHEGTREYTGRVVHTPEDWEKLTPLDPGKGFLGDQVQCLRMLVNDLGETVPVIQTIFSPLAQAKNLAGQETLLVHMRKYPDALHLGLRTITESILRFNEAARETGIAGIFYAVQHAQYQLFSEAEYQVFGRAYDLEILKMKENFWLNVLHLHGSNVMFDRFLDYPLEIVNWHDRETWPSLKEAQGRFPGVLCGGLRRWETMVLGSPGDVEAEARDALRATGRNRIILGTGCVTPTTAPHGNLVAARRVVENPAK